MKYLLILSSIYFTANAVTTGGWKNIPDDSPRLGVINGNEAGEHDAPFYVTIEARGPSGKEFCGGTIISRNYVLTAAHCLQGMNYNEITAGVHILHQMTAHRMMFANSTFYIHEKYNSTNLHNDLALIKLNYKIQILNEDVQIVKLPKRSEANNKYVNETLRIYGRGDKADNQKPDDYTVEVRYLDVPVITNTDCQNGGITDAEIYDGNICTSGNGRKGACRGDSGGPLVRNGVLIGVVSYGESPCSGGTPSVFSKVDQFLDWLADHSDVKIED